MEHTFLDKNNQLTLLNNALNNDITLSDNKNSSLIFDNTQ